MAKKEVNSFELRTNIFNLEYVYKSFFNRIGYLKFRT